MKTFATKHKAQTAVISRLYTPTESSISRCTTTKLPREWGISHKRHKRDLFTLGRSYHLRCGQPLSRFEYPQQDCYDRRPIDNRSWSDRWRSEQGPCCATCFPSTVPTTDTRNRTRAFCAASGFRATAIPGRRPHPFYTPRPEPEPWFRESTCRGHSKRHPFSR